MYNSQTSTGATNPVQDEQTSTLSQLHRTSNSIVRVKQKGKLKFVQKILEIRQNNREYIKLQIKLMKEIKSDYVVKIIDEQVLEREIVNGVEVDKKKRIIMPYYSNRDLQNYLLENPKLSLQTKLKMFIDILSGLMELHTRFITHRDLKLNNIFVDETGRCIVGDLGISSVTEDVMKTRIGTLCYQAPQVLTGKYDQKIDIWGLGIIAFQLFNPIKNIQRGELSFPFSPPEQQIRWIDDSAYKKYMKYTQNILPLDSSIPFQLSYLIQKMLKNNLDERIDWIQIYSSDILFDLTQDKRLINMEAEYKCVDETRKVLKDYKQFIRKFMKVYYKRLLNLLYMGYYSSQEQREIIRKNSFDFNLFFYLGLKKTVERYKYFEVKKIYRTIWQYRQQMKQVLELRNHIERKINTYLIQRGQIQITKNTNLLKQQYYDELQQKIHSLMPFPQYKQVQK